jgi:hypothetical protein
MQTSTRDPAPEIPIQLEDLPDEIHGKILKVLQEETWASAVKNLVERERIKLESLGSPITVDIRTRRRGFFGNYYTDVLPVTFQDLEHITERFQNLNVLTPLEYMELARDTLTNAESQINYRTFLRTRDVQRQLEKDVRTANYLEHLLKKSY